MDFKINFDKLEQEKNVENNISFIEGNDNEVAIIGVNSQIGSTKSIDEFWEAVCDGRDLIGDFPYSRRYDAENIQKLFQINKRSCNYPQKAYLDEIDKFDAGFFAIPPVEAELMDPVQRIFLESAYLAFEDAGYSKERLYGSKTEVYVGYNSTEIEYNRFIDYMGQDKIGLAVSGNVSSIIASRISHLLNLKGPAMLIDTACSSSLSAVYLAYQQIQSGEIDLALVGGIRVFLHPGFKGQEQMGIMSDSERTRTFEDNSDGTGAGEGVISIVLKNLSQAIKEHDNIYAVIKGGSSNQDGKSTAITAPNSEAQENVLLQAWKDADVSPESISYIEVHGTATNLGDPIEISGIEKAFSKYTNKKQFCGIGSVKTNIGHLDCAAGIAGLLKAVLMLKYKKIPPSLYFKIPNRNINFINSPVYVNDTLQNWEEMKPLRCGVSSFGISGTNVHLVLEEAPEIPCSLCECRYNILTISAKSKDNLLNVVNNYKKYLSKNPEVNFADFCYSVNTGRGHYAYRIAMVLESKEEFIRKEIFLENNQEKRIFYGEVKVIKALEKVAEGYITEKQYNYNSCTIKELVSKLDDNRRNVKLLTEIISLYCQGAEIEWKEYYKKHKYQRLGVPVYPYENKRYWINIDEVKPQNEFLTEKEERLHPIVDCCLVNTYNLKVYETVISTQSSWELREHVISGNHVMPGTYYVEIARFLAAEYYANNEFNIDNLLFLMPMICNPGEKRILNIILNVESDILHMKMCSRDSGEVKWSVHVELGISPSNKKVGMKLDLKALMDKSDSIIDINYESPEMQSIVEVGNRWRNTKRVYKTDKELLVYLELQELYDEERESYFLYPSLLDGAVNVGNMLTDSFCLPLSYSGARFYEQIPRRFYSYLKKKDSDIKNEEVATFEVFITDIQGKVIANIDNYVLKKADKIEDILSNYTISKNMLYQIHWKVSESVGTENNSANTGKVIILRAEEQKDHPLILRMKQEIGAEFIEITEMSKVNTILEGISEKEDIKYIINMLPLFRQEKSISDSVDYYVKSAFQLVKAVIHMGVKQKVKFITLTERAMPVSAEEDNIYPINQAVTGMMSCIGLEHDNFITRVIDCDENQEWQEILTEILSESKEYMVSYRQRKRYTEELCTIDIGKNSNSLDVKISNSGAYIIAGGLGGIGLAVCESLFHLNPSAVVILLSRSYQIKNYDRRVNSELEKFKEKGYCAIPMNCDIGNEEQIKSVLQEIRTKYGTIRGVVNAAGIAGNGFIYKKDWKTFADVLYPKILGTHNLFENIKEDKIDFFVMFSSFTSSIGAAGQSDYSAANAFLDSFAYQCKKQGIHAITINWTGWSNIGMAYDNKVEQKSSLIEFINRDEGIKIFENILKMNISRVLVGKINPKVLYENKEFLDRRIRISTEIEEYFKKKDKKLVDKKDDTNIVIIGRNPEEITEIERNVAQVWAKTLGVNEVNLSEKFFEAGGNSLLASYLQKELDKEFPGKTAITDIFIYPTIESLAAVISDKLGSKIDEEEAVEATDEKGLEIVLQKYLNGEIEVDETEEIFAKGKKI